MPRLKAAPVLRAYIANKSNKRAPRADCVFREEGQEPSSSSNHGRNDPAASDLTKRRRLVLPTRQEARGSAGTDRKLVRAAISNGSATPRTLQIPPPGFIVPEHLDDLINQPVSGANASGSIRIIDSSDSDPSADSANPRKKKPRFRPLITPGEAQNISQMSVTEDRQALGDAESLWQMLKSPVYGDPISIEGEFSELAILFAKRGLRWVKMAQMATICAPNRRLRSEHRARVGYGCLKPIDRIPVFSPHEDFDLAKKQYVETLNMIIESQQRSEERAVLIRGA